MSRQMKHSGVPWIGEIPRHWDTCAIKNIMRNISVKGFPNEQVLSLYREYGVIPKNSRDDNHNVTSEDTSNYKLVEVGNFVINKMKAWQGSMAVSDYRGIISPAYYTCCFTNGNLNKRYIHYLLRNESYKTEYLRLSTGLRVGQWDLNIDDFLHIPMILPPFSEQKVIADFLDTKCAEIDQLVALQEKFIEELKAYKQSLITETVTKGLNSNVQMKDSGVDWIGEIPEGWKVDKVTRLFGKIGSGTTPKFDNIEETRTINWLQSGDINGSYIDSAQNKLSYRVWKEYSTLRIYESPFIIIAMYGASIGNTSISNIDACVNQACCVLQNSTLNLLFAFYSLLSAKSYWSLLSVGGGQPNISQEIIKQTWLPLPPLPEQQAIAAFLNKKCSEIDKLITIKQKKIEELKEYKKSLIYEYVTGKKEVDI